MAWISLFPPAKHCLIRCSLRTPRRHPLMVSELRVVTKLDSDLDLPHFPSGRHEAGRYQRYIPDVTRCFPRRLCIFNNPKVFYCESLQYRPGIGPATWLFQAIDPKTGEVLQDSQKGFLAPNNATGTGAGYVGWSGRSQTDVATGTIINASARVITNNAPPQESGTTTHTVDTVAPTTILTSNRLSATSNDYQVKWKATDDTADRN